jgi:hypothetical protein
MKAKTEPTVLQGAAKPAATKFGTWVTTTLNQVLDWPVVAWALLAFILVFTVYFLKPVFINTFVQYMPVNAFDAKHDLGIDLREYLGFSRALLEIGTPYINPNYYPPLQSAVFLPLINLPFGRAFLAITLISFISFLGITILFPLLMAEKRRISPQLIYVIATGFFSWGLIFQLERGQFDLPVMALCLAAVYIYHRHPRLALLAYVLFWASVQIKIYPIIFILCFVRDFRDWKANLLRWALLGLANFAGLFVLGPKIFMDFVTALTSQVNRPTYWSTVNHSANSFYMILVYKYTELGTPLQQIFRRAAVWVQFILLIPYFASLAAVIFLIIRRRLSVFHPTLILLLTIGTMVIPSTSHDYKFCYFIAPMALWFHSLETTRSGRIGKDILVRGLVLLNCLAYAITLFSHNGMPLVFNDNFPALIVLTLTTTALLWLEPQPAPASTAAITA